MFSRSHFDRTIFIVTAFSLPHSCRRRTLVDAANPQLCSRRRLLNAAAFSWPPHSRHPRFLSIVFSLPHSLGQRSCVVTYLPLPHSCSCRILAATFLRLHSRSRRTRAVATFSTRIPAAAFLPPPLFCRHIFVAAAFPPLYSRR